MFLFSGWLLALCGLLAHAQAPRIDSRVDPRVELLSAVARLAGFAEYAMENSRSPYSERVEARFGPLREHPAVATLRELRARFGVSYDAVPSLALHLDGVHELRPRMPWTPRPERLDARWDADLTAQFLEQLRDFADRAKAVEFFDGERAFFAQVEQRFSERASQNPALEWFDRFFGARPDARYVATVGLLCGGQNYGVGVRFADARPEEITPVFGCWKFDGDGLPVFGDDYGPLLVHELCHTYTNPLVDREYERLKSAGEQLFASCAPAMTAQNYSTPRILLYESLVRACVIRCRADLEGAQAGEEQARAEVGRQFEWAPYLARLFGEFETQREKHPTFDSFMPRVVECLDGWARKIAEREKLRPKLVRSTPACDARDVDPSLGELVFEFDRAMRDQSWSIVGASEQAPKITGALRYDEARRVLHVPVRLEPGREYRFSLNGPTKLGFQSAEGGVLAPVEIRFTCAAD